jgi:hypothetical protein
MGRDAACWVVGVAWLAAIVGGLWAWERYDTTGGPVGPPAVAPAETDAGRWRLTVFVHPHCPCARATVGELAELVRQVPDLAVRVVFVLPEGTADGWERGELWQAAARLPGAELGRDPDGREARRSGAGTSGHAVLTDPEGRMVFRGGLTRARGREGESVGRRAVRDWVAGRAGVAEAPVFGCPLFAETD